MKRFFRIIALILCAAALCAALCSCQALDESRERRATVIDDQSFTFRDKTYKLMPLSAELQFIMNNPVGRGSAYLAAEDVPVLLSGMYGAPMFFNYDEKNDPLVIGVEKHDRTADAEPYMSSRMVAAATGKLDDYDAGYSEYHIEYYVREDQYDSVKKTIENARLDHHYITVEKYYDTMIPWNGMERKNILLDDDTGEAIRRTLKNGELTSPTDLDSKSTWYQKEIWTCDKDVLITDDKGPCYMLTDTFDYYLYYPQETTKLYKASDDDFELLRKVYSMSKDDLEVVDPDYLDWYSDVYTDDDSEYEDW